MTSKYVGYKPKVKYKSKSVRFEQIIGTEKKIQGRCGGTSTSQIEEMMRSINAVGLEHPISVEALEGDPAFPAEAQYRLRDGNHRLGAIERLMTEGKWCHGEYVPVKIFECDPVATEDDWHAWQVEQNTHSKKLCTPNSTKDLAHLLHKFLLSGRLGKKAASAASAPSWDSKHTIIDGALMQYMERHTRVFKTCTKKQKEAIRKEVYRMAGQNSSPRVIQYDPKAAKYRKALNAKFNLPATLGKGEYDEGTGQLVRTVSGDDFHAALNSMAFASHLDPTRKNVLVLHVKTTEPHEVANVRTRLAKAVIRRNNEVANPSSGLGLWKGQPMFSDLYFLGQVDQEVKLTFIKCSEVEVANEKLRSAYLAHDAAERAAEFKRIEALVNIAANQRHVD